MRPTSPLKGATTESILSEMAIKEAVENYGMGLKNEILQLLDDDKRFKNIRFQEVFNMMDSNKSLINEHIGQQFETLKALMKAFVSKEVAERTVGDQSILSQVNKRLDGIDSNLESKLLEESKIMHDKLVELYKEMEKQAEESYKKSQELEALMKKLEEEQNKKSEEFKAAMEGALEENVKEQQKTLK